MSNYEVKELACFSLGNLVSGSGSSTTMIPHYGGNTTATAGPTGTGVSPSGPTSTGITPYTGGASVTGALSGVAAIAAGIVAFVL